MTPSAFRGRKLLERLNIVAVGASLSAATAAFFRALMGTGSDGGRIVFITGFPTLLFGLLWAKVLRSPKTVGSTSLRRGWLLSLPLAIANSSFAAGLLMAFEPHGGDVITRFLTGVVLGATFGVMFWLPGLILTLMCFGLPIASAQSLAMKGLAGEERGERIVGVGAAIMAAVAVFATLLDGALRFPGAHIGGAWAVRALAAAGALSGITAAWLAWRREEDRRAFVREVEEGKNPQFRVEPSNEGKVLVRVVSQGEGYRVADYLEEVAALDREGAVTRGARSD